MTEEKELPPGAPPTELYSVRTLFTLGGSSTAVWLVTIVINDVFGVEYNNHRWVGLLVALVLSFAGAVTLKRLNMKLGVVAFFNGLLIYVTTVGIHSLEQGSGKGAVAGTDTTQVTMQVGSLIPWTSNTPWWPATVLTDTIKVLKLREEDAVRQVALLKQRNVLQADSIKLLSEQVLIAQSSSGTNDLSAYLASCRAERESLRRQLVALQSQDVVSPLPVTDTQRQMVLAVIDNTITANNKLLESTSKYLNAGNLNPRGQAVALDEINERINALKNDLKVYNRQLELLRGQIGL